MGASNPIRDLDLMATAHPVGERRMVLANRGLAGIDGTVSTAIGAALGRPYSPRAILYVGDVTFLHDATALALGPHELRPDLTIVVANDDGGSIFATLEQGAPEHAGVLRPAVRHAPRRRPGEPVRRNPYAALAGLRPERARARAGQPQRRHRGHRGGAPAGQPPRASTSSSGALAT